MWKKSAQSAPAPAVTTPPPQYNHHNPYIPAPTPYMGSSSSWSPFLSTCLEIALWYFNFIHPIYVGSKLIQKVPAPNAREVSNCVVAFALLWFLEIGDQVLLRDFIAMRNVYVIARIFFCMYLLHPRFQGALHLYERCGVKNLVDTYGGMIDSAVTQNISFIKNNGAVEYGIKLFQFVLGGVSEILYIVKQLMLPLPPQSGESDEGSGAEAASPSSVASTTGKSSLLSTSPSASPASQPRSAGSDYRKSPSAFIQTPPTARQSSVANKSPSKSPPTRREKDHLTASLLDEDEGGAPSVPASGARVISRTPSGLAAATINALTGNRSRAGTLRDADLNFDDTLYSFANTQVGDLHERMFDGATPREKH